MTRDRVAVLFHGGPLHGELWRFPQHATIGAFLAHRTEHRHTTYRDTGRHTPDGAHIYAIQEETP